MAIKIHEDCALKPDHYGPCAPTEAEYYVVDDSGKVLWRQARPEFARYSDDPESVFQQSYKPANDAARQACIEAAFKLGFLPLVRHHSGWTDAVEWPIEVKEIEPYGDVVLTLPMGRYRLAARRARKGETTSHVTVGEGMFAWGERATDDVPEPVSVHGRVIKYEYSPSGYSFQTSHFTYADGTHSGFLGMYPVDILKVEEQKQ